MGKQKFERTNRMSISEQSARRPRQDTLTLQLPSSCHGGSNAASFTAYDQIDKAPEEKPAESRSTSHVEYQTAKRHYAHVDCRAMPTISKT